MKNKTQFKWLTLALSILVLSNLTGCDSAEKPTYKSTAEKTETPAATESAPETEAVEETAVEETESAADFLQNKGIGPISELTLGELDADMAMAGKTVYEEKCTSCHKADRRFVGPAPKGIFDRRSPEWIMNMILNPEQMVKEDPIAIALLAEYNYSPMANQNLTEEEARQVLEFFRTL